MQDFDRVFRLLVSSWWLFLAPPLFLLLRRILSGPIHGYLLRRYTTVDGLPALGLKRDKKIQGTAVICGGSIAGLLAARVCADHFTQVLLVDPELNEVERTKASVRIAQYDSLHGYLTFVLDGLRRLWPDFDTALRAAGGHVSPGDVKPFFGGTLLPAPYEEYEAKSHKLPETMFVRRPQLENLLRKLLLGSPSNVRTLVGSARGIHVEDISAAPRVTMVTIRGAQGEEICINDPVLTVDCSGDSQAGFKWLRKAGYDMPRDVRLEYDQKLYYVTVTFTVTEGMKKALSIPGGYENAGWIYTFVPDYNVGNAGFVLGRMDNDTMQLCCGGWGDVALPLESNEIEGYVRACTQGGREPVPEWFIDILSILVQDGSPVFKPLRIRPCSYIRYQDVPNLPSNLIALGDSMLQLNPIYAQGCSKAMMGAITLNSLLGRVVPESAGSGRDVMPVDFARDYFRHVGNHGDALWESTKTFDYGFPSTRPAKGETLRTGAFGRWYLDMFIEAAFKDKEVASAMWHVASHAFLARLSRLRH